MKTLQDILNSLSTGLEHIEMFVIDLFCGAGGLSEGVEEARLDGRKCAKVVCCVNHDTNAILSHNANIHDALHFVEDIRILNLSPVVLIVNRIRSLYPQAKIMLHASLECTNFSRAKGGQSRDADSRTLAEHLFRYIETIDPDLIQIENVTEFMSWGPLIVKTARTKDGDAYCPCNIRKEKVKSAKSVKTGKRQKWNLTAQLIPDPALKGLYYNRWVENIQRYGYNFEKRILNSADFGAKTSRKRYFGIFAKQGIPIIFPTPTHAKDGSFELFQERKKWLPVRDVLDLEDKGTSIFDRKKPLSENTLIRYYAGLNKFATGKKKDTADIHYLSKYFSGHPESKNISIDGPAHTIKCIDNHSLVNVVFLDMQYGNSRGVSIDQPAGTIVGNPKHSLITCDRSDKNAEEKLPSFVKIGPKGIVCEIYDTDSSILRKIKEFMMLYNLVDIKMRMLKILELKQIMGFPKNYKLYGTQAEQKKFIGNAVEVKQAKVNTEAICMGLRKLRLQIKAA